MDNAFATDVYERHMSEVQAYAVSQGRPVHVHTVTDGWDALCEFLGVAVPDSPFPRSNSRKTRARTNTHINALQVRYRAPVFV